MLTQPVLSSIFIAPTAQSHGLGTHLLNFTIQRARERHLPVFLTSMPSAVGFYAKSGFEEGEDAEVDLREWSRGGRKGKEGWGVFRVVGMRLRAD